MKKLINQPNLFLTLLLLASALLMPTGAWAQTLVFGVYNERQEFVTVSDSTVNWSAGGVSLPIVFIEDGGKYYRPEGGSVSYTSDAPAVATVDDSGYVTLKAYSGSAPISVPSLPVTTGASLARLPTN